MEPYFGKRTLDLVVAGTACLLFAPLAAGVTAAAWLEDRGPPIFRQARIGRGRQPFTLVKFRSMRNGEVTRVGDWLRRTGIDELPQFVNVCRGEMSVVGTSVECDHVEKVFQRVTYCPLSPPDPACVAGGGGSF